MVVALPLSLQLVLIVVEHDLILFFLVVFGLLLVLLVLWLLVLLVLWLLRILAFLSEGERLGHDGLVVLAGVA